MAWRLLLLDLPWSPVTRTSLRSSSIVTRQPSSVTWKGPHTSPMMHHTSLYSYNLFPPARPLWTWDFTMFGKWMVLLLLECIHVVLNYEIGHSVQQIHLSDPKVWVCQLNFILGARLCFSVWYQWCIYLVKFLTSLHRPKFLHFHLLLYPNFPIMYKVGNIDIFVLLIFENK